MITKNLVTIENLEYCLEQIKNFNENIKRDPKKRELKNGDELLARGMVRAIQYMRNILD